MAKCVKCGATNSSRRKACRACGTRLPAPESKEHHDTQPLPAVTADETPTAPVFEPAERAPIRRGGRKLPGSLNKKEPHAFLDVSARYEFSSAPQDDPPHMGVLVEIEASGQPIVQPGKGAVAHVVLALDLSASMDQPDKYPVLKAAVTRFLDDLQSKGSSEVLVSVVIFSKGATTLIKGKPARQIGTAAFFQALERNPLCFGRYTDVAGALSRAGRIAFDQVKDDPLLPVRVYLLTDGKPQDMPRARDEARKLAAVRADMHALAFGADADVGVLQELFAGKRGGTVKSVRRETIASAFERVAEVARKVVATRCRIAIDLAPGVVGGDVFRYRPARVRYPEPCFAGGKRFRTDLGTVEIGRTYSLLFEIRPQETTEHLSHLGDVIVQIPGVGGPITQTLELLLDRTEPGSEKGAVDGGVRTARDILDALTDEDPQTALRALRLRRSLYQQEKRDPRLLAILDKAIDALQRTGSLDALSPGDYATLMAHTCTSGVESDRALTVN